MLWRRWRAGAGLLLQLDSLGRFLHGSVGVEGLKLLLDAAQRVGQLAVVEHHDGLLDPRQQVRRQALVLVDHLLRLDGLVQHLEEEEEEDGGDRVREAD